MGTKKRQRRRAGFTLIEIMIVIAIILALSSMVGVMLFQRKKEATDNLVKIDMGTIQQALKLFQFDFERWPTDDEGLTVLWDKESLDPDADVTKWKKYLEKPMAKDRYGNEWQYEAQSEFDEEMYRLWSWGRDGEDGTDDDIKSWSDEEEAGGGFGGFDEPPAGG
jgi:general secretion pathway protein G